MRKNDIEKSQQSYHIERLHDPMEKTTEKYFCVENNDIFQVKLSAVDQDSANTYGAVLYLDGHRIPGKKIITQEHSFKGFKLFQLGSQFKEFHFKVPRPQYGSPLLYRSPYTNANNILSKLKNPPKSSTKNIDRKHEGKYGTIIVEFFQAEAFENRNLKNPTKANDSSDAIDDDKKRNLKRQEKDSMREKRALGKSGAESPTAFQSDDQ